jgi:tryptophan halogenase
MKADKIIIVGGGSSGWMTAATLIRAFPEKEITVIESPDTPIIGVGESTLAFIKRWTRFIGLDEKEFFPATDASYKLSIKFTDFYKKDYGSFHYPFGDPFTDDNRNPFFDWHIKKYYDSSIEADDMVASLYPSYALIQRNKISTNKHGEFDNFNMEDNSAYHFDAVKFGVWLRDNYCIPRGVKHIQERVKAGPVTDKGIAWVETASEKHVADLYVDCTGFKSLLLGKELEEPFTSYSNILPNNKAWAVRLPYKDKSRELELFTNCTAIDNGWCWNIPLWSRLGTGYVYSDKFISDNEALEQFKNYLQSDKMRVPRSKKEVESLEFKNIQMRVGIHERTFVKNVVAIGLSAGFIEPLESNGLFTVHEFLFKLVDILHRKEINQFDRDMYNVSVKNQFDSFAKFVSLHYALSHRDDTEYWQEIQSKVFCDYEGDPYSKYAIRTDNYFDIAVRYMEQWGHSVDPSAGIPFISTGLQLNMMNESRIASLEYRWKTDLRKEIETLNTLWKARQDKWNAAAEREPSYIEYLTNKFYGNGKNS